MTSHSLKYDIIFPSLWCHTPIHAIAFHVPICHNIHSTIMDIHTPTPLPNHAPLPEPTPCTPTHATSTLGHVGVTWIPPHHMPHGATSSICHINATLVPYHVMPSDKSRPCHHVPPWTSIAPHYNYPTFKMSLHLILDMNYVLLKTKFNLQGHIAWNERVSPHST